MAIDSDSTLAQVIAQFKTNSGWWGDLDKAKLFHEACMYLEIMMPQSQSVDGQTFTQKNIQAHIEKVSRFIESRTRAGSRTTKTYADFQG